MSEFQIDFPFEKSNNADGSLELFGGIASASTIDRDNERMAPEVMQKIANDLRKNSSVFLNHNTKALGIGLLKSAEVKEGKVFIKVAPTKAPEMAGAVMQIHEGILKSFSIGGKITDYSDAYDEHLGKNVRTIKNVEVHEVSVVGVPSNPEATISSYFAKAFEKGGNVSNPPPVEHPTVAGAAEHQASETVHVATAPGADAHATTSTSTEEVGHIDHIDAPHAGAEHPTVTAVKMIKCAHCGSTKNYSFELKPEPQGGPGEMRPDSPGYYKMAKHGDEEMEEKRKNFELGFTKMVNDVRDEFQKAHAAREELFKKEIAAGKARIELLQKSIDESSKSLQAKQDEMQEEIKKTLDKAATPQMAASLFPQGMTPRKN